jgi:glycosyltransferase involved in cell wall biosynthesis
MDTIDEVILVEGRSPDDMAAAAKALLPEIEIFTEENGAGGPAVKAGYAPATGELLVFLDARGFDDPQELPRFVAAIRNRAAAAEGG